MKCNVRQVQWRLLPLMGLNLHWVISPSYSSPPYALEHIPKLGWGGLSWLVARSSWDPPSSILLSSGGRFSTLRKCADDRVPREQDEQAWFKKSNLELTSKWLNSIRLHTTGINSFMNARILSLKRYWVPTYARHCARCWGFRDQQGRQGIYGCSVELTL